MRLDDSSNTKGHWRDAIMTEDRSACQSGLFLRIEALEERERDGFIKQYYY